MRSLSEYLGIPELFGIKTGLLPQKDESFIPIKNTRITGNVTLIEYSKVTDGYSSSGKLEQALAVGEELQHLNIHNARDFGNASTVFPVISRMDRSAPTDNMMSAFADLPVGVVVNQAELDVAIGRMLEDLSNK